MLGLRARGRAARRVHGADDHAQVPRGDGLCRRGDGAAPRPQACTARRSRRPTPAAARAGDDRRRRRRRGRGGRRRRPRGARARRPTRRAPIALEVAGPASRWATAARSRCTASASRCARGEILGIAGVSGNGQRELVEALVGQRAARRRHGARDRPAVRRRGAPRTACCSCARCPRSRCATPASATSASPHNMALRDFDRAAAGRAGRAGWLRFAAWRERARAMDRRVRHQDARRERADRAACRAATCSARCWRASSPATINVLIAANPVFGLDFAAVAEIHARIAAGARDAAARCCWSARTSTSCSSWPTASS